MIGRREFLVSAIAAAASLPRATTLQLPAPSLQTANSELPGRLPLYKVIYDERYLDALAFGHETLRAGLPGHAIRGDMTALWYHDLQPRWRTRAVAIAGMTAHGPIFCLERLAWDVGMRLVFRAEHRTPQRGRIEHVITGPARMLRFGSELARSGEAWAQCMARVVASCPEQPAGTTKRSASIFSSDVVARRPETLISWIIAPVGPLKTSVG